MPIFNNKVVQKHLDNISVIPDDDLNIIRSWAEQNFACRLADLCPEDQIFKLNKKLQNWWLLDFAELQN